MASLALALVALLFLAGAGVMYAILSINAEANRQDDVLACPAVATDGEAFLRSLAGAIAQSVHFGNRCSIYQNGDEIFPPMLEAIAAATSSVHFTTFVYWSGEVPRRFAEAFRAAASRGVEVRIVLDKDGARQVPAILIATMRDAGCRVVWFRPATWYDWAKYNRRTHRRLLIVDGHTAFTGGVGIADEWAGRAQDPAHWRDTHVRVTGPAVHGLQAAFVDTWNECTGEILLGPGYFPPLEATGASPVCAIQSNPANGASAAQRVVAAGIATAAHSLYITNAYFVPTHPFVEALCRAKARGVDVKVLVPGPYHNKPAVRRASRHAWPELLAAGVELYEHQRTMVHAKTVVVDDCLAVVGSINFDPRSFALNAECAVAILDDTLARDLTRAFRADLSVTRRVTVEDWRARTAVSKALDAICYWFRSQL